MTQQEWHAIVVGTALAVLVGLGAIHERNAAGFAMAVLALVAAWFYAQPEMPQVVRLGCGFACMASTGLGAVFVTLSMA